MVLEALRFATRGDSATPRSALRNGSITSFFSPLSASQPHKAESITNTKLNTVERFEKGIEAVDRPPVSPHSSTPPTTESVASSDTQKRKSTSKLANVAQKRNTRHGTPLRPQNSPSQAPIADPDTRHNADATVKTSRETRTLRSKEKALFKSDLAMYFANYEDILMDVRYEPPFLQVDEPIHIVDETGKGSTTNSPAKGKTIMIPARTRAPSLPQTAVGAEALAQEGQQAPQPGSQIDAKTIHLQSPARDQSNQDPLGDEIYLVYHKRAERKEKQLRNIEKERAQHEKAHLERLLEGLQGPDWLRVLGVTGVTEGEQKEWKPKRDYFIKEVTELVGKFRRWKDAERRLRLKKEREREVELESEDDDDAESGASDRASSSELDARAAYQLLQEAGQTPKPPRRRKAQHVLYEAPPSPEQPFTGFYKDPHLRAQALGEVRHGRHVTAFGVALPEPPEEEFELWQDLTTHDSRRARERKRRKVKDEPDAQREFL